MEKMLINETFEAGMDNWWVEGGQEVHVVDGRLYMKADPPEVGPGYVATAWCRTPVSGDVRIEYDAHVIHSEVDVNNINFFFYYADPAGQPLEKTKADRADGGYKRYHDLNGYIVTFLKDAKGTGGLHEDGSNKARFRMRRCPGFNLIDESFGGSCEVGVTYHCVIIRKAGRITFEVNGEKYLEAVDPNPLAEGLIGLRTYRTELWWDNIRVIQLD